MELTWGGCRQMAWEYAPLSGREHFGMGWDGVRADGMEPEAKPTVWRGRNMFASLGQ